MRQRGDLAARSLAWSLVELGAALRRRGERTAAREPLRRALDLASARGVVATAERAPQDLDRPAAPVIRPHRPHQRGTRGAATLVAAGLLGTVMTLAALFLPGMRAIEGAHRHHQTDGSRQEPSLAAG
jgi:hypothetical protein